MAVKLFCLRKFGKESDMKTAQINFRSMELGYKISSKLATSFARKEFGLKSPTIVAWHDKILSKTSPTELEGGGDHGRWHIYGETHGGELEVAVNGEYDFILADTADFEPYGPCPYVSVRDQNGTEMLCQISALHIPRSPSEEACITLDEWTSKLT